MDKLYKSSPNLCADETPAETMEEDAEDEEETMDEELTQQEENIVTAALLAAVEEGNLEDLKRLLKIPKIDVNLSNRHGETLVHMAASFGHLEILKALNAKGADITLVDNHGDSAMYWAARQGHTQIIRYLYEQGVDVNLKNKIGETSIHVAARYGQAEAIEQLCRCGANINTEDDHGETALHIAVWHGFPKIVHVLGDIGAHGNVRNKDGETPLHCAAARGHIESTKHLLESGVDLNLLDKYGCTALVLALRRHHTQVAMLLLNAGCNFEIPDGQGEKPIHIAAREGLLQVCQRLCSLSCAVNTPNRAGFYSLHLAAKKGHIEIVRRLCLAGAQVEAKNRDGITAEISAIAQGHSEIADLLDKVKVEQVRSEYVSQLASSNVPLSRVKIKFFGHSGTGKSTLIESLKCGYFSSWFRRSSRATTVSKNQGSKSSSKSSLDSSPPVTPTSVKSFSPLTVNNDNYTRGIDVQQVVISGVGDFNIWEFSGRENYYQVYDHFIGSTSCFHIILFRLCDPPEVQIHQVLYWLSFLQSRIPVLEPLSLYGKSKRAAKILLIGTHADLANCQKIPHNNEYQSTEVDSIFQDVKKKFQSVFDIHETILLMDAHVVGSQAMKQLKLYLSTMKTILLEGIPMATPFLQLVNTHLQNWRKSLGTFPVMSSQQFTDMIREKINPLVGEEHVNEVVQQLQVMGDILYLKGRTDQDLVILNPRWLTVDVVGFLLRPEYINRNRITGCYSVDDIQLLFPDIDSLDLLQVIEVLQLCTQCDIEGDIEYEFPSFINLEKPEVLWSSVDVNPEDYCYGGIRLQCAAQPACGHILSCLFPRLQIILRQCLQEHPDIEGLTLRQWRNASRLQSGFLEAVLLPVALDSPANYGAIEVQVRGPVKNNRNCFYFFEDILNIVETAVSNMCPSLQLERHYCNPADLQSHKPRSRAYHPAELMTIIMSSSGNVLLSEIGKKDDIETLADILCFGLFDLRSKTRTANKLRTNSRDVDLTVPPVIGARGPSLASELHITNITLMTKQTLCMLLDPQESMGRDWCMLGVRLGLTDKLPKFDPASSVNTSPTWRLLEECYREEKCTIKFFIEKLKELGREDAMEVMLRTAPLIKIFPQTSAYEEGVAVTDESSTMDSGINSCSQASSSNLSR